MSKSFRLSSTRKNVFRKGVNTFNEPHCPQYRRWVFFVSLHVFTLSPNWSMWAQLKKEKATHSSRTCCSVVLCDKTAGTEVRESQHSSLGVEVKSMEILVLTLCHGHILCIHISSEALAVVRSSFRLPHPTNVKINRYYVHVFPSFWVAYPRKQTFMYSECRCTVHTGPDCLIRVVPVSTFTKVRRTAWSYAYRQSWTQRLISYPEFLEVKVTFHFDDLGKEPTKNSHIFTLPK